MNKETKQQVQGCFFDLMVAMDPSVGDILEVAFGLAYMTLMQHHKGDPKLAADSMQEALNQCLNTVTIVKPPLGMVAGGKLDS